MQNGIQYIAQRHATKEEALMNKRKAASLGVYLITDPSFDEIKYLATHGYTWARVGEYTHFVSVDIDDSNITHAELSKMADEVTVVTASASGKEYKHHIFRWLETPISYAKYKNAIADIMREVQVRYPDKYAVADPRAYSFYQCFYGHSTASSFDPWHGIRTYWTKKGCPPEEYDIRRATAYRYDPTQLPLSVKSMNKLLTYYGKAFSGIEYMTYDVRYRRGDDKRLVVCKVPQGHRYNTLARLVNVAAFNAAALNRIGLAFTVSQAESAVLNAIKSTFEAGKNWIDENMNRIHQYVVIAYEQFRKMDAEQAHNAVAEYYKFPRRRRLGIETPEYIVGTNLRLLLDADAESLTDYLLELAMGEVSFAKELYREYAYKAQQLNRQVHPFMGQNVESHRGRPKADYAQILAAAPIENDCVVLPGKYKRNASFRHYLKTSGYLTVKWS